MAASYIRSTEAYESSLAFDTNDYPHISYIDQSIWQLNYAQWNGSSWDVHKLIMTSGMGSASSIKLNSKDEPVIVFHGNTNRNVIVATINSPNWSLKTVDAEGDNFYCLQSLAIDSSDNIHIAYYDSTNKILKHTYSKGEAWRTDTVGALPKHTDSSIAIDNHDRPTISYYDLDSKQLKFAIPKGDSWLSTTADTVDGNEFNINYNSLAITNTGRIWIAVYAPFKADLKFVTGVAGFPWPIVLPAILTNAL